MSLNYKSMRKELCEECGTEFIRPSGKVFHRCPECRAKRQVENMVSQHTRSGPIYERSVRRLLVHYRAEAKRLGIRA